MYSDILLNVISWLCRTLFFWNTPTFYGVTGNTRIDYILCPRAFLPHITSCKVWRRAGDILQIIQTNNGVITDLWYSRYEHDWPTKVHHASRDTFGINTRFSQLQHRESIATPSSMTWRKNYSDAFLTTHHCWTLMLYMNGCTAPCEKLQRNTSLDQRKREGETMSTKLPRHTVLNAVETSAHCVIYTLKRGRYDVLAQEPLRQITMFGPLNVLSAKTSNALDSLSYKKPGNVAILLQHGNSHGFSRCKELDQRNVVLPLHRLHHFPNRKGWNTLRDQAVKEAALLHLWTYLKQDMYQQQTTLTQRIGHELANHVFENVWQEHPFAKLTQRGLFLVHYGDCWSIQMRLEANNVTASALNNVRHAQMFLTRFFALWFGTCLSHEEHLEVGTCLKVQRLHLKCRENTVKTYVKNGYEKRVR